MKRGLFTSREWQIFPTRNSIVGDRGVVHLEPRVMELLVLLANRAGEVVTRAEILGSVWAGSCVGDDTVNVAVSRLRRALGDTPRTPMFIATVPKRGYRWIAEVEWIAKTDAEPQTSTSGDELEPMVAQETISSRLPWLIAIVSLALVATALVVVMVVGRGPRILGAFNSPETSTDSSTLESLESLESPAGGRAVSDAAAEFRSLKIRGWRLLNHRDTNSILAARQYFQRMVGLQPDSATAHASVSAAYSMEVDNAVGNEERRDALESQARNALAKAVALDSSEPTVLYARGLITLLFDRDHASALADLRLAQSKLPTNPRFSAALAWVWVTVGETTRATEVAATTLKLDPTSIQSHLDLAALLSYAGRFDEALDILELALELDPTSMPVIMVQAWVLEHAGQDRLAFEALIAGLRKQEVPAAELGVLEGAWERDGLTGVLNERAELATLKAETGKGSWLTVGSLRSRGHDTDGAIKALQRSQQNTEGLLIYELESPDFRSIRKDTRFQALVGQVRVDLNARSPL